MALYETAIYTVSHKRWSQLIFICNLVKNKRILMLFAVLDLTINDTHDGMNFTNLTSLMLLHYLVKVETPKMHVNTSSAYNVC